MFLTPGSSPADTSEKQHVGGSGWEVVLGRAYSRNPWLLDTEGHWASVKGAPEEWRTAWFRALVLSRECLAPGRHLATSAVIWLSHLERRMLPTSSGRCYSASHTAHDCNPHKKDSPSYECPQCQCWETLLQKESLCFWIFLKFTLESKSLSACQWPGLSKTHSFILFTEWASKSPCPLQGGLSPSAQCIQTLSVLCLTPYKPVVPHFL